MGWNSKGQNHKTQYECQQRNYLNENILIFYRWKICTYKEKNKIYEKKIILNLLRRFIIAIGSFASKKYAAKDIEMWVMVRPTS